MFGGVEALQDIFGFKSSHKRKSGKGKGPRSYAIETAEQVASVHYEHPMLLGYLNARNDKANLFLFNQRGVGDVAKKMGYKGRKVGHQFLNQLEVFLGRPFEVGDANEKAAIKQTLECKNTMFLCLVSASGDTTHLEAAATFHVSSEGDMVFLSWLVVSQAITKPSCWNFFSGTHTRIVCYGMSRRKFQANYLHPVPAC